MWKKQNKSQRPIRSKGNVSRSQWEVKVKAYRRSLARENARKWPSRDSLIHFASDWLGRWHVVLNHRLITKRREAKLMQVWNTNSMTLFLAQNLPGNRLDHQGAFYSILWGLGPVSAWHVSWDSSSGEWTGFLITPVPDVSLLTIGHAKKKSIT